MDGTERIRPTDDSEFFREPKAERPLGALVEDLTRDAYDVVAREVELAKMEMAAKASKALKNSIAFFAGLLVVYAGVLVLLFAAVLGLSRIIDIGLAALAVGLVVLIAGAIVAYVGQRKLFRGDYMPRKTIQSFMGLKEWTRNRMQ